jgi:alpha-glucosidase
MLAFRRATPALRTARTRFFDLAEPVLAFSRGDDLACVFNLSGQPVTLTAQGLLAKAPSQAASLTRDRLTLGANGFCFLQPEDGPVMLAP